jgi:hypothetical protein
LGPSVGKMASHLAKVTEGSERAHILVLLADAASSRRAALEIWEKTKTAVKERAVVQDLQGDESERFTTDSDVQERLPSTSSNDNRIAARLPDSPQMHALLDKQEIHKEIPNKAEKLDRSRRLDNEKAFTDANDAYPATKSAAKSFVQDFEAIHAGCMDSESHSNDHGRNRPLEITAQPAERKMDR